MVGGGCRAEENKGEKKWDNCNSIINKIYIFFRHIKGVFGDKIKLMILRLGRLAWIS